MTTPDASPAVSDLPLSEPHIAAAAGLSVFDARGNRIRFGNLFEFERTVVVFIRHFFCGSCQQYVSQLTTVRPEALDQAGIKVIVIGCGDWMLINNYRELTCPPEHQHISFYADPTRMLYRAMGLTTETLARTPKGAAKRSYLTTGNFEGTFFSILRALKSPLHIGKQGNFSQLGGEFILGPNNKCSFAHQMQHTEDHTEVDQVFREAGVTFP